MMNHYERMNRERVRRDRMARFGMFCMDALGFSVIVGVSLWVYHLGA
jgi:hypothetical protein